MGYLKVCPILGVLKRHVTPRPKNPESSKFLLLESGIQNWNPESTMVWNPESTALVWNPESRRLESRIQRVGIQNPDAGIRNLEAGIRNPGPSWILLHGAIMCGSAVVVFNCCCCCCCCCCCLNCRKLNYNEIQTTDWGALYRLANLSIMWVVALHNGGMLPSRAMTIEIRCADHGR